MPSLDINNRTVYAIRVDNISRTHYLCSTQDALGVVSAINAKGDARAKMVHRAIRFLGLVSARWVGPDHGARWNANRGGSVPTASIPATARMEPYVTRFQVVAPARQDGTDSAAKSVCSSVFIF